MSIVDKTQLKTFYFKHAYSPYKDSVALARDPLSHSDYNFIEYTMTAGYHRDDLHKQIYKLYMAILKEIK